MSKTKCKQADAGNAALKNELERMAAQGGALAFGVADAAENIQPETRGMVETWRKTYGDARDVIMGIETVGN